MLVCVVEILYWMVWYFEWVENMVCLINVNINLILDILKKMELGWELLIDIIGMWEMYEKYYDNFDECLVMKYLISDVDSFVLIVNLLKWVWDNGCMV